MSIEKENFLRTKFIHCLQQLDPSTPPRWGKMSVQQMIEHFAEAVRNACGKNKVENFYYPIEQVAAMHEFMMTDKPFKENTKNPFLGEEPDAARFKTVQAAIGNLQEEFIDFFAAFEKDPQLLVRNPFFGDLNFEQSVQLLYKHAAHHLRQFGA